MSLILNIDTALDTASISISSAGVVVDETINHDQKDHAGFLQLAIQKLIKKNGLSLRELDAIAVNAGPGSYTGLRVGMASAKGLCYALQKPLLLISSLEILTIGAIEQLRADQLKRDLLFCPMIDARRMEVFTAVYDSVLKPVLAPCSMILDENSFANIMLKGPLLFFGNGSEKWKPICNIPIDSFVTIKNNSLAMSKLSDTKYNNKSFVDIAYAVPEYIKGFYTNPTT